MKKQHGTGTRPLPAGQVTPEELLRIVAVANEGAWRAAYFAKWHTGDRARRDSLYDSDVLEDLNDIEDFSDLRFISLDFYYDRDDWHDTLEVNFLGGALSLRWSGTMANEKARRVSDTWAGLPKRARLSDSRILWLNLSFYVFLIIPLLVYNIINSSTWLLVGVYALIACASIFAYGRKRLFVGPRAAEQPFITSRPASAFQQPGFSAMLGLTMLSIAVAVASFIRDAVAG